MSSAAELRNSLSGVIASLATAFDSQGNLSAAGLKAEVQFLLNSGIKILVCGGSIGEFSSLTISERKQLLELTLETAGGKALVLAGCAAPDVGTVLELTQHAAASGAHAIMLTAPYYFKSTSEAIHDFFKRINKEVNLPFIIYNNPSTTKVNLSLDLIERMSRLSQFAALKESCPDLARYFEERERFGSRFPIIAAGESVLVFQLLAGAEGLMTASVLYAPNLMQDLWHAAREKRVDEAFDKFSRLFQFRKLLDRTMSEGFPAYVSYTKAALEMLGIPVGPPRSPLSPLAPAEMQRLERVLRLDMGLMPAA
jgi:dihydrodipicolinate synthase/N-acetylneuraminate lyase